MLPHSPAAYIHAVGGIGHQLATNQSPPSLREQARQRFGPSLRQASRFVALALLGVADCLKAMPAMPAIAGTGIALYVATGLGEVQKTMALFVSVTGATPEPAAPFDFINAANNTAAFYIAKHFTGSNRNFTICDGDLSFESALQLALWECRRAAPAFVLVGGVDEAIASRTEYARRYEHANAHTLAMGEGSYWFLLSAQASGAIAEVLSAQIIAPRPGDNDVEPWAQSVAQALRAQAPAHSPLQLLPGAGIDEPHQAALMRHCGRWVWMKNNAIKSMTYANYPTSAALNMSDWLTHASDDTAAISCAAHISRDPLGRTAVTLLRASQSAIAPISR